ncbi:MAG: hypothetical protein WAM39_10945 [Bryobacteraceae bacterium]
MTPRYLRIVFFSEFLVAVIAIFTAWSEIGGQAVLDAMPWGWKGGLGLGLAGVCVAYSVALTSADSVWNIRTAKWLALILALVGTMGVVTFYYALQVQNEPPDEQDTSATLRSNAGNPTPPISPHRKFA